MVWGVFYISSVDSCDYTEPAKHTDKPHQEITHRHVLDEYPLWGGKYILLFTDLAFGHLMVGTLFFVSEFHEKGTPL